MKKFILSFLPVFISFLSFAQSDSLKDDKPFTIVEQMPVFPGGDLEMMKFIQRNVRFPIEEMHNGISGTCYVTFVVEKDGSITDVKVIREIKDGPGFSTESINVIKKMPKWQPGKQNGKEIRVQYNLPIKFIETYDGNAK